jgi:SnoaL-like domain
MEVTMADVDIRAALERHWIASAAGDQVAEHEIYQENAIVEYPQSGERIRGRQSVLALRSHHPSKPAGFVVRRIVGSGELWVTEYLISYDGRPVHTVSIMEFEAGKVARETQYFAEPFEPPSWREQWTERST